MSFQFINHRYTTADPQKIEALRLYSAIHKLTVVVEGEGVDLAELIRLNEASEEEQILQAEAKEQERAERENQKKEEHEFYSTLRGSDHAYR